MSDGPRPDVNEESGERKSQRQRIMIRMAREESGGGGGILSIVHCRIITAQVAEAGVKREDAKFQMGLLPCGENVVLICSVSVRLVPGPSASW